MKRMSIYLIGLALGVFLVWNRPVAKTFSLTVVHQALTQNTAWVNTTRPLTADDLTGRILLLDFWTYCCINCMHVIPELQALEHRFGEQLTVIGVHSGKFYNERDGDHIKAAIHRYNIEHPVVNDANFSIWDQLGVHAWPTLILVNPLGKIEKVYTGEGHGKELERDIDALVKKYAGQLKIAPLPLAQEETKHAPSLLSFPGKLAFDPDRQLLFISDSNHHRIVGTTLAGEVKMVVDSDFNRPQGILVHDGAVYVADTEHHLLRKIDLATKHVETIAGTGVQGQERFVMNAPALTTAISSPWDLAYDAQHDELVIAMAGTHQLWAYSLAKRTLRIVAGNGLESIDDGVYPDNSLSQPSGISEFQGKFYFVDSETSSLRVLEGNRVTTLIGTGLFDFGLKDGPSDTARMQHPIGVFADNSGVYIADTYNHAIRFYDVTKKTLSTLCGGKAGYRDGALSETLFNEPNDVVKIGDKLYVADTNNHQIRVIELATRTVTTLHLTVTSEQQVSVECDGDVCVPTSRHRV